MKLWPSRKGILHGIRTMEIAGDHAVITTHCGRTFTVRDSRTSRASRWLRNKIFADPCPICAIPEWKLKKYQGTVFRKKSGAILRGREAGNDLQRRTATAAWRTRRGVRRPASRVCGQRRA
ncbi:MAG: pyrrolysine--tRNA(Pyl) ligase small subunit [Bilophila wadsworthia]